MPLDALFAVTALCKENRKILPQFRVPLLMVHSEGDPSCKVEGARYVFSKVSSSFKRLVVFEKAPHGLMHDGTEEQRALLVQGIVDFVKAETA